MLTVYEIYISVFLFGLFYMFPQFIQIYIIQIAKPVHEPTILINIVAIYWCDDYF